MSKTERPSRRDFLKKSSTAVAGAALAGSLGIARRSANAANEPRRVNWKKHKVIVFENDDWCGNGRFIPGDRETYERACRIPEIRAVFDYRKGPPWQWSTPILETPADMQKLFDLLLRFKGADGRPVIFTPICLAANQNCAAIRENNFERYIDMSIADGFPDGQNPGDIIGKAKEGIRLGVWYPQSHGRAHHYSGKKWVRALREKRDKTLLKFFEFNVVGWPTPPWDDKKLRELRGLEFDDMTAAELDDWFQTGQRFFRDAFGYDSPAMAITDARDDNRELCKGMLARSGARVRSHTRIIHGCYGRHDYAMGSYNPQGGLRMGWTAKLDPLGEEDEKSNHGCSAAYKQILASWQHNLPAIVGGHRINYCSLNPTQVVQGHAQTERLLATIGKNHPDAVYLTSTEVGQLYRRGMSVLRQGHRITCRNYTERAMEISMPNPGTATKYIARNLRNDAETACHCDAKTIRFIAPVGEYAIEEA